jgi:hypothetical protein
MAAGDETQATTTSRSGRLGRRTLQLLVGAALGGAVLVGWSAAASAAPGDADRGGLLGPVAPTIEELVDDLPVVEPALEGVGDQVVAPAVATADPVVDPPHPVLEPVVTPILAPVADAAAPVLVPLVETVDGALAPVRPVVDAAAPIIELVDPVLAPVVNATAPTVAPVVAPVAPVAASSPGGELPDPMPPTDATPALPRPLDLPAHLASPAPDGDGADDLGAASIGGAEPAPLAIAASPAAGAGEPVVDPDHDRPSSPLPADPIAPSPARCSSTTSSTSPANLAAHLPTWPSFHGASPAVRLAPAVRSTAPDPSDGPDTAPD